MPRKWGAPNDLIQHAEWPGVSSIESFSYTCSHGTSPGVWQIVTAPQSPDDVAPEAFGNLLFTDGFRTVILRNCKADSIRAQLSGGGLVYTIQGFDRRWLWRNQWGGLGGANGRYNQLDARGKLKPWSIRSPVELARALLAQMGELNYVLDLPAGLPRMAGADLDRFLRLGENFIQTNTNPETSWDRTPPADALAQLADTFGCRIVFDPVSDRVLVVPQGKGLAALPDYPYESIAPSLDDPETPIGVGVSGAPTRFQARFSLEAVGEEWDGSIVPIDQLSYAPLSGGAAKQKSTVTHTTADNPSATLQLVITWTPAAGPPEKSVTVSSSDSTLSAPDRLDDIAAKLNADADFAAAFTIYDTGSGSSLGITAREEGLPFVVVVSQPGGGSAQWVGATPQAAATGSPAWDTIDLYTMSKVRPTDRLSHVEAKGLALKSVFKWYRIRMRHNQFATAPDTLVPPLVIAPFGTIDRVSQITLQNSKVEQVVPAPRIAGGDDKGKPVLGMPQGAGALPEFYNGRSRDQAATVTGSVWKQIGTVTWTGFLTGDTKPNTRAGDRVFVPFGIETLPTGDQIVNFSEPVVRWEPQPRASAAIYKKPDLTLECSCTLTDRETDQLVRYEKILPIPGGRAPVEWHRHEDLQVGVINDYLTYAPTESENPTPGEVRKLVPLDPPQLHKLKGWHYAPGDLEHADPAANAYLAAHARKYVQVVGDARQYVGIWPISPDGAVQQVTWSLGGSGPSTTASLNGEHSPWVPPYPARRRAELLPPDKAMALSNAAERAVSDRMYATPGGAKPA